MQSVATCLMFVGDQHGVAGEAMSFYVSLFEDARITDVEHFGVGEEEPEGTVKRARFLLRGREFIALDGGKDHASTFTPAVSIFVHCDRPEELDELYTGLSSGGEVLMPLQPYPLSARFGWVNDRSACRGS